MSRGYPQEAITMTERMLLTGTNHQTLEQEAFAWATDRAKDDIGRVLYISETGSRHDRIKEQWRESYGQLTLRTETLTSFVFSCYETLEGPSALLSGEIDQRALEYSLDTIIADRPWLSTQPYASANLVDAFDRRFARFQNLGLNTPERVQDEFTESSLPPRIRDTTIEAYETYYNNRAQISEPWHVDYSKAFEQVAESDIAELEPHIDAVILSGFIDPGTVEQAVLQKVIETFPTAAILPSFSESRSDGVDIATETMRNLYQDLDFETQLIEPSNGDSSLQHVAQALYRNQPPEDQTVPEALAWRELPTPEREVRYVAREIRQQLSESDGEDDIGVVIPGFAEYEAYLADVFDTFGLEYDVETGGPLADTFVGSAIKSLVLLSDDAPRASDLTQLVTNPVVNLVDSEGEDAITAAERYVDSVRVNPVLQELSPPVRSEIDALLDRLDAIRDTDIETAIETLRTEIDHLEIAEAVDNAESRIDAGREKAALEHVDELLSSFEHLPSDTPKLSATAGLLRAIQGATLDGYTGSSEAITVLDHTDAKEYAFDQLYIVGLTTEHFPSVVRYPAFFEQMVDAHPVLEVLDERLRDRYLFATLLANANAVTLTTPSTDTSSTAVVRSPVLDELNRVTGIEPTTGVDDRIGSTEDLQRAISPLDDRRAALDAAGDRGDLSTDQTIHADRGIQCATERAGPDVSPHDGLLDPETVEEVYPKAKREPFSSSRIERYVNCGFQFYAEQILGFEDEDEYERTPDPLETGSYIHDTFERFYIELQSAAGETVALQDDDLAELEAHMLDIALDELDKAELEYTGIFYQRWLEQLFAGLGDQSENPYYGGSRPHQGVERGLFSRFVEREYNRDGEALPAWFEAPFGEGLYDQEDLDPFEIELPNGSTVAFRGYIDRVDLNVEGEDTEIQLFDYKSGSAPSMTTTTGGTTFQLPIYLRAAEQVLTDDVGDMTNLSATYYQTKPPNRLKEPRGIESKFDSDAELREFLDTVLPQRLQTVTTAIEQGRFHTTVLSQREAGCEWCSYRRSCDIRPHQRRDRVEVLDADPQTYVPLRATSRSYEEEFGGEADD